MALGATVALGAGADGSAAPASATSRPATRTVSAAASSAAIAAAAPEPTEPRERGGSTLGLSAAWLPAGLRARRLTEARRYRESQLALLEAELALALAQSNSGAVRPEI